MASSNPFKDKIVLVTGAGSRLGHAISIKLASLGASLALADLQGNTCQDTAAQCASGDGQSHLVRACDVSKTEQVHYIIESVLQNYSRIDHVVNCSGISTSDVSLESTTDDYWHKLVDTNLKGAFNIARECIPHLKSGASIVNVASATPNKSGTQSAVYSATEAGIVGFSQAVAEELKEKGVRSNIVTFHNKTSDVASGVVDGDHASGKVDIAVDAVVSLLRDETKNGKVVHVDGSV